MSEQSKPQHFQRMIREAYTEWVKLYRSRSKAKNRVTPYEYGAMHFRNFLLGRDPAKGRALNAYTLEEIDEVVARLAIEAHAPGRVLHIVQPPKRDD